MFVIGTFMAWYFYVQNPDIPNLIAQKFSAFYKFLFNKWYFDELYDFLFVQPAFRAGRALWKKGDGAVIDGFGPDGISETVRMIKWSGRSASERFSVSLCFCNDDWLNCLCLLVYFWIWELAK